MSKTTAYHFAFDFPAGYVGSSHEVTVRMSYLPTEADQMEAQARATAIKSVAEASGVPAERLVARLTQTEHMPDGFDPIRDFEARWPYLKTVPIFKEMRKAEDEGAQVTVTSTEVETRIQGEVARIREEGAQKVARIREEGAQKVAQVEAEIASARAAARVQGEEDRRAIRARHVEIRAKLLDGILAAGTVVFAIWSPLDGFATLAIVVLVVLLNLLVRE